MCFDFVFLCILLGTELGPESSSRSEKMSSPVLVYQVSKQHFEDLLCGTASFIPEL